MRCFCLALIIAEAEAIAWEPQRHSLPSVFERDDGRPVLPMLRASRGADASGPAPVPVPMTAVAPAPAPGAAVSRLEIHRDPVHVEVDTLSLATGGAVDYFLLSYWGAVVFALIVVLIRKCLLPNKLIFFSELMRTPRSSSKFNSSTRTLDENLWSMCLASCYGQVFDWRGRIARSLPFYLVVILMGMLQLFALALIVYDIDPDATPVTDKPSTPWKKTGTSVNCMKFIMVLFQSLAVVAEAGCAFGNLRCAWELDSKQLNLPKVFAIFLPIFHYLVTLGVILGGVSVVLSCQAVPSVLYNSLAILFVTQMDEMLYKFFEKVLSLEVNWEIPSATHSDTEEEGAHILEQIIVVFPALWAFSLLGRAWYTNTMPVYTTWGMQWIDHFVSLF